MGLVCKCTNENGGSFRVEILVGGVVSGICDFTLGHGDRIYVEQLISNGVEVKAQEQMLFRLKNVTNGVSVYYTSSFTEVGLGHTGEFGNTIGNASLWEMTLIVDEYENFVFGDDNDGYPINAEFEYKDWNEFTKDRYGYPTNTGVWKFDSQNDGYPWIVGYLETRRRGDTVKIMENGAWCDTDKVVLFENNEVLPVILKIRRDS